VIIDFSIYAVGTKVVLPEYGGQRADGVGHALRRYKSVSDDSTVPTTLRPFVPIDPASASVARVFTLSMGMGGRWFINGRTFDPNRIDARPRIGTTEIWTFRNTSSMAAPDAPACSSLPSSRCERRVARSDCRLRWLEGHRRGSRLRHGTRLSAVRGLTGVYVQHCHILEHEDRGMMSQFEMTA